jgi:hypothetical protein
MTDAVLGEAVALLRGGRVDEAAALCRTVLDRDPGHADALYLAGTLAFRGRRTDEAVDLLRRSAAREPHRADRHQGLGDALYAAGRLDEAEAAYERALALWPEWFLPYHRLGMLRHRAGCSDRAIELLRQCIARAPQYPYARMDLSMLLLQRGEDREGWQQYEWRWKTDGRPLRRPALPVPTWDGRPLAGRTLLLWSEQGYGDVIQFARFLAMIPKDGGRILVHVPGRVAALVASCPGVDEVLGDGEWCHAELQFPLMSLPSLLGVSLDALSRPAPYLFAPRDAAGVEGLVPRRDGTLNVGVVWASSRPKFGFIERDCPAGALQALARVPGVRLFGLQFGERAADVAGAEWVTDLSGELGDFHRTAAFVERMDLVVTVDTAMAHLAGALGKAVWTLLSHDADWRWMLARTTSPWYPTMRLYRQPAPGDWEGVLRHAARDLAAFRPAPAPVRAQGPPRAAPRRERGPVFKQYGEMRTGTNFVRAVLMRNYPGATVLMHVLGDKHAPPPDFAALWAESRTAAAPAFEFVRRATFGTPSLTTREGDPGQLRLVARLAEAAAGAYERGELGFLVSLKDPYAWAASVGRFHGWAGAGGALREECAEALEAACLAFNARYAAWLALVARHPASSLVIRHEDVVADPRAVLRLAEAKFGLPRAAAPAIPPAPLVPAPWDHSPIRLAGQPFDPAYYRGRRYLDRLRGVHREVVTRTIDWGLLAPFGYRPVPAPGEREE